MEYYSVKATKNTALLNDSIETVMSLMKADLESGTVGGFVVVVDPDRNVHGTITDSDLRRKRQEINLGQANEAQEVMNTNFVYVKKSESPLSMARSVLEQFKGRNIQNAIPIEYIPVLDSYNKLNSIMHISSLIPSLEQVSRQIVIHGQGFAGLTLAMAMVNKGLTVFALESNQDTIDSLVNVDPKVYEPQLEEILINSLEKSYFISNKEINEIPRESLFCKRIHIIAVGTPLIIKNSHREIDLSNLFEVIHNVSSDLKFGDLIIIRSTVPVGTTRRIRDLIFLKTGLEAGSDYYLSYAPERTVEGNAIAEVTRLPQLLGGYSKECERVTGNLFAEFVQSTVLCESLEACELAKLISNSFRDVSFAFANEVSILARQSGVDVNKLIADANLGYSRNQIPTPSPGVGGPCLTKDSYMLGLEKQADSVILSSRKLNERMVSESTNIIRAAVEKFPGKVAVIGVAFKGLPPTNDTRQSTCVEICNSLRREGYEIWATDSVVSRESVEKLGFLYLDSLSPEHSVICVLNNHPQNLNLLLTLIRKRKSNKSLAVFDPWNLTTSADSKRYGFKRYTLSITDN